MKISRRNFVQIGASFGTEVLFRSFLSENPAESAEGAQADLSFSTLEEAFDALKFNPDAPNASFFAVTSDIHYIKDAQDGFQNVVPELNALKRKPAFLAILGDNISSMSPSFGSKPNYSQADEEMAALKADLGRVRSDLPVHLLIGNHDTFPYEKNASYFCDKMNTAPYYSFDESGVHFVFLNGAHDGSIDDQQKLWLDKTIRTFNLDSTIVLAMHQPLGESNERGLTMILPEIFDQFTGNLWLLCGHGHVNQVRTFQLPKTVLREVEIASCVGGWNHSGANYWIFCLRDGQLVGRIDRRVGKNWTLAPEISIQNPRKLRQPFEAVQDDILVSGLMGQDAKLEIIEGQGADCGTYWFYLTTITASLPFPKDKTATRLALLGSLNSRFNGTKQPIDAQRRVFLSGDGSSWTQADFPSQPEPGQVWVFNIPDCVAGERLYFKIVSFGYKANDTIAGAALLR